MTFSEQKEKDTEAVTLIVVHSRFFNNSADSNGGAVVLSGGFGSFFNTTFLANAARIDGGAVSLFTKVN